MESDRDLSLFRTLAAEHVQEVLELLIDEPMRQISIGARLELDKQTVAGVTAKLISAGLIERVSTRAPLVLSHLEDVARLLSVEAELVSKIHRERASSAEKRERRVKKRILKGRSGLPNVDASSALE